MSPSTRTRTLVVALALVAVTGLSACDSISTDASAAAPTAHHHQNAGHQPARLDPVQFHADMRKLWEDHITWTRLYIVSAIAGLPDTDATAGRLLQNQADIGAAIAGFYGADAGAALTELLRQHILIAAQLVGAAKAGDAAGVSAQHDAWYANADQIAAFLAAANPAWPLATLRDMMRTHLDQTLAEAVARLHGDWAADIADYDAIHVHILHMADVLADGIVHQFPKRFTS